MHWHNKGFVQQRLGRLGMPRVKEELIAQGGESTGRSRLHRRVLGERVPVRTTWSSLVMRTSVAVKVAMHPWSHSWPMEIREPDVRSGKMCAWQAESGRRGMFKVAMWVEVMRLPSGSKTEMLGLAGLFWEKGAVLVMK